MNRTGALCATLVFLASFGPGAAPAADRTGMQHHASFVSGGVGASSQEDLKAREREFNLKLVFTLVEGNYVADVNVAIRDAGGLSWSTRLRARFSWRSCRAARIPSARPTRAGRNRGRSVLASACVPSSSAGRATRRPTSLSKTTEASGRTAPPTSHGPAPFALHQSPAGTLGACRRIIPAAGTYPPGRHCKVVACSKGCTKRPRLAPGKQGRKDAAGEEGGIAAYLTFFPISWPISAPAAAPLTVPTVLPPVSAEPTTPPTTAPVAVPIWLLLGFDAQALNAMHSASRGMLIAVFFTTSRLPR